MILSIAQVIFVGSSIALVVLILLQQSKGAALGASFGAGASATVFGARGAGSFLYKLTRFLALVFCVSALAMGYVMNKAATSGNILAGEKGETTAQVEQKQDTKPAPAPISIPQEGEINLKLDTGIPSQDNAAPASKAEIPLEGAKP